jgi:hypothetical protein
MVATPAAQVVIPAKMGVVLSGCGVFDGSEIHETVSILLHKLIEPTQPDHFMREERLGELRPDPPAEVGIERLDHHHQITLGVHAL